MRYLILVVFLFLYSCKSSDSNDLLIENGYDYFPTDFGLVKIYSVDSIAFNDNTKTIDTFHFKLKEVNLGMVLSGTNINHLEISKLVQKEGDTNWLPRNSYFVLKTNENLQTVNENIRVVKLQFPIGIKTNWNGNMYNNLGRRTFTLSLDVENPNALDTLYLNTISVQEAIVNNPIEEIYIRSIYKKGVGLVDFVNTNINTQLSVKSGYKVKYKLLSYSFL